MLVQFKFNIQTLNSLGVRLIFGSKDIHYLKCWLNFNLVYIYDVALLAFDMQLGNLCCFHYFRSWPNLKCLSSFHRVSLWALSAHIENQRGAQQRVCNFHTRFNASVHRKPHTQKCLHYNFQFPSVEKPLLGGKRPRAPGTTTFYLSLTSLLSICSGFVQTRGSLARANKEVTKEKKAPVFNTQMMSFSQESAVRELCM